MFPIDKVALCAGSVVLGYGWSVEYASLSHLKTNDSVAIPMVLEFVNPWFGTVSYTHLRAHET